MAALTFRDLDVWKRSMDLVVDVYSLTGRFPRSEVYGLTAQMRRAATSIPANIAEGNGRAHRREYAQYISIARGSVAELTTYLEIATRLGYVEAAEVRGYLRRAEAISSMLLMLIRALRKSA